MRRRRCPVATAAARHAVSSQIYHRLFAGVLDTFDLPVKRKPIISRTAPACRGERGELRGWSASGIEIAPPRRLASRPASPMVAAPQSNG